MEGFLKETGFSASKLLQQGIAALMCSFNKGDLAELIQHEKDKCDAMMRTINKQRDFIESKGLIEEYIKC
jgi:Ni2+-binding GTPase involved in maturation of urease and hydrogenase